MNTPAPSRSPQEITRSRQIGFLVFPDCKMLRRSLAESQHNRAIHVLSCDWYPRDFALNHISSNFGMVREVILCLKVWVTITAHGIYPLLPLVQRR